MNNNKEDTDYNKVRKLEHMHHLSNFCFVMSGVLKHYVSDMLKQHKEHNIKIPRDEKFQWEMLLKTTGILDNQVFDAGVEQYKKYQNVVTTISFIIIELMAKCDDSNTRLWQFHNLLKTFPTVFPALLPTLEEEYKAFADVLGYSEPENKDFLI